MKLVIKLAGVTRAGRRYQPGARHAHSPTDYPQITDIMPVSGVCRPTALDASRAEQSYRSAGRSLSATYGHSPSLINANLRSYNVTYDNTRPTTSLITLTR